MWHIVSSQGAPELFICIAGHFIVPVKLSLQNPLFVVAYTVYPHRPTVCLTTFPTYHFFTSQITLFGTSCERPFTGDSDDCRSSHGVYLTTLQVKFGKQNTVQPSPIPKRLEVARTHFPFTASDRACTRASFWRHRPSWILSNQSREEGVGASDLEAA